MDGILAAFGSIDEHAHGVGGNGETDAQRSAVTRIDRGVDAQQLAVHRQQRAAGIAGIDGGVGLDEFVEFGNTFRAAAHGGDDAVGDGLPDAERIADRQHQIADLRLVAVLQFQHRQFLAPGIDAQHGNIGMLVMQDHLGGKFTAVAERDANFLGVVDHMVVGDDQPVAAHDHARAERVFHPRRHLAARHAAAEELLEEGIGHDGTHLFAHAAGGIDVHDGGRGGFDQRRKGIGEVGAGVRRFGVKRERKAQSKKKNPDFDFRHRNLQIVVIASPSIEGRGDPGLISPGLLRR